MSVFKNKISKNKSASSSKARSAGLMALSSAALALPGIASAAAPTETTLSYRYTQYQEDELHSDQVANESSTSYPGSTKRYEIDVHHGLQSLPKTAP